MRGVRLLLLLCFCLLTARGQSTPETRVVTMLLPGFTVRELPVQLPNINNLRFAPDGSLTALGYDGRVWLLTDRDGDGLEDSARLFWDQATVSVPVGMAWSSRGLLVSSRGKVSLLVDTEGDGKGDAEEILASGWPATDVGSGGVDATGITLDPEGNVYFGLMAADYSNAYRLRKRKALVREEIDWLKSAGRWREPMGETAAEDEFSLYDLGARRGTIQRIDLQTGAMTTIATGVRVPVALAFNRLGDLFSTDQEGETWMPNGNPLDELNHIIPGRNYGFPPAHPVWLPGVKSEPPVVSFGPQHQSACGLVFNEPQEAVGLVSTGPNRALRPAGPGRGRFGPPEWEGNAMITGQSRGKIYNVSLRKTPDGYVGRAQIIARLSMLPVDLVISKAGRLYVACHSGPPDWGSGPLGVGRLFQISYDPTAAPLPLAIHPTSPTEVRVLFDRPVDGSVVQDANRGLTTIEFGEHVSAGDSLEVLKPPYAVVEQQTATPRGRLQVRSARLESSARALILETDPHPLAVRYAVTITGIKTPGGRGSGAVATLDYDLTMASQPLPADPVAVTRESWGAPVSWAPQGRASSGTDSRPAPKPDGDWEAGRELFHGGKLQCAKCHRVRGVGGTAGPDLGNLVHRDATSVLRDIRDPNATLHPEYVTHRIVTKAGAQHDGFIRAHGVEEVRLLDVDGKETRVARSEIQSVLPTGLSLMPTGLLDGLTPAEVKDLLTFLLWEPPQRSAEELASLSRKRPVGMPPPATELRLVLVATRQDHGQGQHDYPAWQKNWSRMLTNATSRARTEQAQEWPSPEQFTNASAIVFYCWNHDWSAERLAQVDTFLERGGGIALIHSAVISDNNPEQLAARIGLSAHPRRTGYRHMPFELELTDQAHPITHGFPPRIHLLDEPYWPLIGDPADVHVLAGARIDGALRPLIWATQKGKGRIFASIPGHYTWTLNDPLFRAVLLRGISWAAGEPVQRLTAD